MKILFAGKLLFRVMLLAALSALSYAQMTVTGSVAGNIADPAGQMIVGARLSLVSDSTKESRNATTNDVGAFTFLAVPPGTYSMKVEQTGFKTYQQTGVVVTANERIAMGDIQLQIGAITDTISVEAKSAQVQTDSSEHSAEITSNQLQNLTARGRDVVSMLRTIPGVAYQADNNSVGDSYGSGTPSIGGASSNTNILAVDGVVSNDTGTPSVFSSVTTLDAIGEVKVILNSYQAEYAGNGGAVIEVITKSGGREYHGSGYYYGRNEALNANDFFNNRTVTTNGLSIARPRYRYTTAGASLGGPIYIPGKWNTGKNKLFGFYNLEQFLISYPGNLTTYTMPTALERAGDFSQSFDVGKKALVINDPTTGAPFPGNKIPSTRLNQNGLALMKALPLPNTDPNSNSYNYNYVIQETLKDPKRSQLFKIDYVPTDKDHFFVRGKTWLAQQEGYAVAAAATPTGFFGQCYCFTESGLGVGGTHVFSPNLVMEFAAGVRHNHEAWHPYGSDNEIAKIERSTIGFNAGQWYPQSNVNGFIPKVTWGVTNSPNIGYDNRLLTGGTDFTFNLNDNLTYTHEKHTFKAGMSVYRIREYEGEQSTFAGAFDFSKNTANPLDTGWAYGNAALGVFNSYTESSARYGANMRQTLFEWFVQDNWKITRRFTLDYGIRFTWASEMYPNNAGQQSVFAIDRYKASDAPPLYQPVLSGGVRYAQNPVTKALLPAAYVGLFVPGIGNPAPGGVTSGDKTYAAGFVNQQPVLYGPRLGFAYDVFGNGKTAIRGGAAILYNPRVSKWSNMSNNPPAVFTPITYYGDISSFLQTAGLLSPASTQGFNPNNKTSDIYNISVGLQQDMGHSILVDVSYLGTLGQHLSQTYNINTVPYGSRFLTQNTDPTNGKPLTDNFFRPYPGYGTINFTDNAFNSNYHALLLSVNRRFSRGLQFGLSYTFSKYLDYTGIPVYNNVRSWSYGFDGADQTHNLVVNFTYQVPGLSKHLGGNKMVRYLTDDWVLSGISQFVSGTPASIGLSTVQGTDLTGGGDGQRVNVVGNPNANGSTFYQWFNPAAFALPATGSAGNAAKNSVRNPGVNNNDMSLSKRFNIGSEKRALQFKWEAYNVFNHTEYATINTAAKFDIPTGQQVNTQFGQVLSTRSPRVMQGSLRFTF